MLIGLLLAASLSAIDPAGAVIVESTRPAHEPQPTVRTFARRQRDQLRRLSYRAYCEELAQLWREYRAAGSSEEAFQAYLRAASDAKTRYVLGADDYRGYFD